MTGEVGSDKVLKRERVGESNMPHVTKAGDQKVPLFYTHTLREAELVCCSKNINVTHIAPYMHHDSSCFFWQPVCICGCVWSSVTHPNHACAT